MLSSLFFPQPACLALALPPAAARGLRATPSPPLRGLAVLPALRTTALLEQLVLLQTLGTNGLMCPPPQSQRHWFSLSPRVVLSVGPRASMAFLEGELDCTAGEALPPPTF